MINNKRSLFESYSIKFSLCVNLESLSFYGTIMQHCCASSKTLRTPPNVKKQVAKPMLFFFVGPFCRNSSEASSQELFLCADCLIRSRSARAKKWRNLQRSTTAPAKYSCTKCTAKKKDYCSVRPHQPALKDATIVAEDLHFIRMQA